MAHFDPYHQWLGIPPDQQPPDHYRLLGIRQAEDDATVIENAADRQMAHLKTFQAGPRSADSQRLLNEVAAARICLLNVAKKNAYDQQLRQASPQVGVAEHEISLNTTSPGSRTLRRKKSRNSNLRTVAGLGGTMLVVFILIVIFVTTGKNRPMVPENADSLAAAKPTATKSSTAAKPRRPRKSTPASNVPPDSRAPTKTVTKPDAGRTSPHPPDSDLIDSKNDFPIEMAEDWMVQGKDDLSKNDPNPDSPNKATPDSTASPEPKEKPPPSKPDPKSKSKQKLPVPSPAQQKEITKRMEGAYDFSAAKTPWAKRSLARQLLRDGLASRDADGEPLVLIYRSAELSILAGDATGMFKAGDAISARYEIDPSELNLKLLKRFTATAKTPADLLALRQACQKRIDEHLAAGRYQAALDAAKIVNQATQRLRNKDFRKQILTWQQAIAKLQKEHQAFELAQRKLADMPDNANAAITVGRWYCFAQDDYSRGLPFLAKGSDSALAAVAKSELGFASQGQSPSPGGLVALGDTWWEMAEKAKGADAAQYRLRALHWYWRARPRLSGLERATVTKRFDSFAHLAYTPFSYKTLDGILWQIEAVKSGSSRFQQRRPIQWRAYIRCDDSFEMCVNGKKIFGGTQQAVLYKKKFEMAPGDIITVRCKNNGGTRGFCCVIRSERGHVLVSGPTWRIYEPKNPTAWADPIQVDKIAQPSSTYSGVGKKILKDTGVKAKEIWGRGDTSYLMLKVQ